jgi:inhibitor of KinA
MDVRPVGDKALLVRGLAATRWSRAERFAAALSDAPPAIVTEIVPAFDSVAILYDPAVLPPGDDALDLLGRWVLDIFEHGKPGSDRHMPRMIEIAVRYGGEDGPDLKSVAEQIGMPEGDVVRLHTAARYRVLAVGFMPGFGYLGGLPDELKLPRRVSPRTRVEAGSVGIGGPYTGVYPFASPGGWHLIGRTDMRFFDPESAQPALLAVGDVVRFVAVGEPA